MDNTAAALMSIIAIALLVLVALGAYTIGYNTAEEKYEFALISAGLAEYRISDSDSRTVIFKWIEESDE